MSRIFETAEIEFKAVTSKTVKVIPTKEICDKVMKNEAVISIFRQVCQNATMKTDEKQQDEVLHSLLSIYLKVRGYSFARSVVDNYKAKKGSGVKKSLRKEIKRSSNKSDM